MKNLDDPKTKMFSNGLASLTDSELLTIFFRKNKLQNAKNVLSAAEYNLHELAKMSVYDIINCGINESEASYVVMAMELGRRRNFQEAVDNGQIKGSKDAAEYIRPMIGDLFYEEFWVIYLNRRNAILTSKKHSMGGMTGTVIDVRLVLKFALDIHATGMILCHNHPSGNLEPSDADKSITRKLKEAAAIMEVPVIDHLIVTQFGHFSFADEGLL
ncbi:MAG: JAB domain-containing protein [Prolixibacteraceae bacterium]